MPSIRLTIRTALVALGAAGVLAAPAKADYFAGKTITLLVGAAPGGGYDAYARTIARHLPDHLPGKPTIVVRNQPGAGSAVAAAALANTAPKDGTWIGGIFPGAIIGPVLDPKPNQTFDPSKLIYLGSADSGTRVCITGAKSNIKTFDQARETKTVMGASQAGGSTRDYAYMLNNAAGAKFEVVSGYRGTSDIFLAIERGEVDGMCGLDWTSFKAQRPDWIAENKVNIIIQTGLDAEPELEKWKTPTIWPYITSETDKKAVELILSQQVFGRPYAVPPGTPDEAVEILRTAFMAALKSEALREDADKARLSIAPISGKAVGELVAAMFSAPSEIVERARRISLP